MIKIQLYNIPIVKYFWAYAMTLPVDRTNREEAIRSMDRAVQIVKDHKMSLLIAPEGTRRRKYSEQGQINILPLKKGAFHVAKHTGARIVPVIVVGAGRLMPVRSILLRPGTLFVKYCKPIDKAIVEKLSFDELLKHTEKIYREEYFNQPDEKVYSTRVDNRPWIIYFSLFMAMEIVILRFVWGLVMG